MYSKSFISLIIVVLCFAVWTPPAYADSWTFSPYRAQLAAEDESEPTPVNEATPADATLEKKNIGRGVMFSLVIPGAGQLYSGSWLRALPWFAIEVAAWTMFSGYKAQGDDKTAEFEAYAGPHQNTDPDQGHFNYDAYMLREYQIARNAALNELSVEYSLDFEDWKRENWDDRSAYLPPPFGHNINTPDIQQYYEMIGKYFTQFGYGWIDTYDTDLYPMITGSEGHIWAISGDDAATIRFDEDSRSPFFYHYRDMRGEANDFLDKSNVMMEIVLANHVLSALDAAFAIRGYNRKLADGRLGFKYNPKVINGSLARMFSLSIALN